MNDQEQKSFDEALKSKLGNHIIQPSKNLMPGILDQIQNDSPGAGSAAGFNKFWPFVIIGVGLLGFWGYIQYNNGTDVKEQVLITNAEDSLISENETILKEEPASRNISNSQVESLSNDIQGKSNTEERLTTKDSGSTIVNNEKSIGVEANSKVAETETGKLSERSANTKTVNVKKNSTVILSKSNKGKNDGNEQSIMKDEKSSKINAVEPGSAVKDELTSSFVKDLSGEEPTGFLNETKADSPDEQKILDTNDASENYELSGNSREEVLNNEQSALLHQVDRVDESNSLAQDAEESREDILSASEESTNVNGNNLLNGLASNSDNETFSNNSLDSGDSQDSAIEFAAMDSAKVDSVSQTTLEAMILPLINNKKWSFDIMAGPSLNYRILDFEENRELENHKNEFESSIVTYSYAANVRRKLYRNWHATVGFMYLEMGEKYEFSNNVASHSAVNEYNYYSIPVGIDVNVLDRAKTDLIFGLGAQMNFLKKGTSSWLDPQSFSAQVHSNDDSVSPFSEQTFAWNAKLGVRYELSPRLDIILEEQGLLFNNSVYKKETGLIQKEYSFRTFIGIGFKL